MNEKALFSKTTHGWKYIPARPWTRLVNSGLVFLSKYELVDQTWEKYGVNARQDKFAAKGIGAVTAVIRKDGVDYGKVRVMGTHMQAGDSKAEQKARRAQAEQAASFIQATKQEDIAVTVFGGDLNMGPRQDPECKDFSVHYTNQTDALARCSAYEHVVSTTGLQEAKCVQSSDYEGDICRFLVCGNGSCEISYEQLLGADGKELSDTKPMCLTITLTPKSQ